MKTWEEQIQTFKKVNKRNLTKYLKEVRALAADKMLNNQDVMDLESVFYEAAAGEIEYAGRLLANCDTHVRDQAFSLVK